MNNSSLRQNVHNLFAFYRFLVIIQKKGCGGVRLRTAITRKKGNGPMQSHRIALSAYQADDSYIGRVQKLVRDVVIPYQYQILNDALPDAEKSHAVENIRLAGRKLRGEAVPPESFYGMVFQDSDVAKWIEAAACTLTAAPDPELERRIDALVALIGQSQHPDGYLNSYFTVKAPERRWTNLRDAHELYCAGHMMEAAVAYFEATGKRELLDIMCRNADCLCRQFLERDRRGCPGHPEVELALMRLWRVTGIARYRELARHFIDVRGQEPNCFAEERKKDPWPVREGSAAEYDPAYSQSHQPVREQRDAVGHAVRAVYLFTGMADVARETGDEALLSSCRALWESITKRRMYVTGGIGSTVQGEAFTEDFDLPNDTAYAETCASIGLIFFAKAMLENEHRGEYGDVMEQAFYNTVLAGMQLDGRRFFYVNPLECVPGVSGVAATQRHVLPERPGWYACACCPPNAARLISSLGAYAYSEGEGVLFADLYAGGAVRTAQGVTLRCETGFPNDGLVRYTMQNSGKFTFAVRIPAWSRETALYVNGRPAELQAVCRDGYAYLKRDWQPGDVVELRLDMTPRKLYASPRIAADSGRICIRRGAQIYCAEEADNGPVLPLLLDDGAQPFAEPFDPELLGGVVPVRTAGFRLRDGVGPYTDERPKAEPATIRLIPYAAWANRGPGQMRVWLPAAFPGLP